MIHVQLLAAALWPLQLGSIWIVFNRAVPRQWAHHLMRTGKKSGWFNKKMANCKKLRLCRHIGCHSRWYYDKTLAFVLFASTHPIKFNEWKTNIKHTHTHIAGRLTSMFIYLPVKFRYRTHHTKKRMHTIEYFVSMINHAFTIIIRSFHPNE